MLLMKIVDVCPRNHMKNVKGTVLHKEDFQDVIESGTRLIRF